MSTLSTRVEENVQKVTTRTVAAQNVQRFSLAGSKAAPAGGFSPDVIVPGVGNVVSSFVDVGSSSTQELILTITNLNLTTNVPACVICQPRQNANQNFSFPDIFGVQVVTTSASQLLVRIRRLDGNSGWGQDLRLDVLIFDQVNNP